MRLFTCRLWFLVPTVGALLAQTAPSPARIQFVDVEPGVRLEVLDWGGRGRPVVLLAGLTETAHTYDDFAPKLTDAYHVYGITRRGFGASSVPRTGYTVDRLADDVLAVLDALQLVQPVLAGHSVAGEELSAVGARDADRIAGLVYLDAAGDRTYSSPKDVQDRLAKMGFVGQPKPVAGEFDPAHEIRARVERPAYEKIRVPAMAFFPVSRTWRELMPGSPEITDPDRRALAGQVLADVAGLRRRMADAFRSGVTHSRVVEVPGAGHYIFRTNEADVLREMRGFLQGLK